MENHMNRHYSWCKSVIMALLLLASALSVTAANNPGHDSLYVLRLGDNVTGNFNITGNISATLVQVSTRFFGNNLDIRADGTSSTAASRLVAGASDLSIQTQSGVIYLADAGGTEVRIGGGQTAKLNVSGDIYSRNTLVCLQNGSNCAGTGSSNLTLAQVATNIGNWSADKSSYTLTAALPWTNTTTTVRTSLDVNLTARATTAVPLIINANAAQTANLTEWKYDDGSYTAQATMGPKMGAQYSDGTMALYLKSTNFLAMSQYTGLIVDLGGALNWVDKNPESTMYIGSAEVNRPGIILLPMSQGGNVRVMSGNNTNPGAFEIWDSSGNANLTEWRNTGGTTIAYVNKSGTIFDVSGRVCTAANGLCGGGSSNLTLAQVATNIGNWSAEKGSLQNLTYAQIVTSIGNFSANGMTTTQINTLGNYSANPRLYVNLTAINANMGNWSSVSANYYTITQVNTLGNFSASNAAYVYATQNTTVARTGNCAAGTVVMNTTNLGVQCIATGSGNVSGAGTSGTLTKFTAGSTIGNSVISESGTMISITGSGTVSGTFNVTGKTTLRDTVLIRGLGGNYPVLELRDQNGGTSATGIRMSNSTTALGWYIGTDIASSGYDDFIIYNERGARAPSLFYVNGTSGYALMGGTDIGVSGADQPRGQLHVMTNLATDKTLIVQGATSQSANLTEWQNKAGAVLSSINSTGRMTIAGSPVCTAANGLCGSGSSNLTLADINTNMGNYSANPRLYVNLTAINANMGNWSSVSANYYTITQVNTLGNFSANGMTTTQIGTLGNFSASNAAYVYATQNTTVARTGNCSAGYVVMNTTNLGVQCVALSGGNSTFNQSLTDTLYYPRDTNPAGFYNSSTLVVPYQSSAAGWTNTTITTSTALQVNLTTGNLTVGGGGIYDNSSTARITFNAGSVYIKLG
jgi:hypothetical protein